MASTKLDYEYQLRDYRIKRGEMDSWIAEWKSKVLPLRLRFGFRVVGAWQVGDNRFVWIIDHDCRCGGSRPRTTTTTLPQSERISSLTQLDTWKSHHWMMKGVMGSSRNPRGACEIWARIRTHTGSSPSRTEPNLDLNGKLVGSLRARLGIV